MALSSLPQTTDIAMTLQAAVATHVSTFDWVKIVLASGAVAAILTKVLDGLLAKFQRKSEQGHQDRSQERELNHQAQMQGRELTHQLGMQEAEQRHQRRLQLEAREDESLKFLIAAHDKARETLLESAVDAEEWLTSQLQRIYGSGHDFSPENEPQPSLTNITDVLAGLRRVEVNHPTSPVRSKARDLRTDLSAHYGSIGLEWDYRHKEDVYKVGINPSENQLFKWIDKAEELIEGIHRTPSLKDILPWSPFPEGE